MSCTKILRRFYEGFDKVLIKFTKVSKSSCTLVNEQSTSMHRTGPGSGRAGEPRNGPEPVHMGVFLKGTKLWAYETRL